VLVQNSQFNIGNLQTGMLLAEAGRVDIQDNHFAGFGSVLVDGGAGGLPDDVIAAALADLVRDVLIESPPPGRPGSVEIAAGRFTALVPSAVDQADWDRALRANPPTEAELADSAAFEAFVTRLGGQIADDPRSSPSLGRALEANRIADEARQPPARPTGGRLTNIGQPVARQPIGGEPIARQPTGPRPVARETTAEISRGLVLGNDRITVQAINPGGRARSVTITLARFRISFNSDLTQANWNQLLGAIGQQRVASNRELLASVQAAARTILTDAAVRRRLPFAVAYFDRLVARLQPVAGRAIICAGEQLEAVSIRHNSFNRVFEAAYVERSTVRARGVPAASVPSVLISGNRISLAVPITAARGQQGLFIGSADRVNVAENEILYERAEGAAAFDAGIELTGAFGAQIHLRENTVLNATTALRVTIVGAAPTSDRPRLWRAIGNLAINGARDPFVFPTVTAGANNAQVSAFIETDNVGVVE
jgi:hypothetical protein